MAVDRCMKATFGICISLAAIAQYYVYAGVLCYQCDNLPHQRDCDRIVECGSDELCYGEKIISDDGLTMYKSGCRSKARCTASDPEVASDTEVWKRADIIACSRCCNNNYCNLETCDVQVTSNGKRCLSCKYALHPDDCNLSIQCNEDETCYTQAIIHNQEKRYRLGCVHKNQCGLGIKAGQVAVGRRAVNVNEYCGRCCDGRNCNRELCKGNNNGDPLSKPPQLTFCRDNSTTYCTKAYSNNPGICNTEYYKYYQCPYTCKQCDTAPVITIPPVTPIPGGQTQTPKPTPKTTTIDPNVCANYPGIMCDNMLVCTVDSTAKLCKETCGLCSGGGVVTKPVSVTTSRPAACKSQDPIPECQCKYLDEEADICKQSETIRKLKKFCCYYCKRKNRDYGCPDALCDRLEQPEKNLVESMTQDIKCIHS